MRKLLLITALSLLLPTGANADTITLRADEWCPFNCQPEADKPGFGIEIARAVFTAAGHDLDYRLLPWTRALDECRKGAIAAVIGTTPTESPDFVFPAEMIARADNAMAVKKGNPWRYAGPASLDRLKVGIIQGYVYMGTIGDYLEAAAKAPDHKRLDTTGGDNALELNLKKLLAGRVDVVIDSGAVLTYKIQDLHLTDKVELAGSADLDPIYVAFSPALPVSKDLAALFDRSVADLRASGKLQAILSRYGQKDWKN